MSIQELKKAVIEAALVVNKQYKIERVQLFGSQARGTATAASDVDLIIEFAPNETVGLFALSDIENIFQQHLQCKTDVTTPDGLDALIRDQVLAEAQTVYER